MRFYTDDPFRFVDDGEGTTWCYNPEYGNFINMKTDKIVPSKEVPEKVRELLLNYSDDDEFNDRIERIIDKVIGQRS